MVSVTTVTIKAGPPQWSEVDRGSGAAGTIAKVGRLGGSGEAALCVARLVDAVLRSLSSKRWSLLRRPRIKHRGTIRSVANVNEKSYKETNHNLRGGRWWRGASWEFFFLEKKLNDQITSCQIMIESTQFHDVNLTFVGKQTFMYCTLFYHLIPLGVAGEVRENPSSYWVREGLCHRCTPLVRAYVIGLNLYAQHVQTVARGPNVAHCVF